MKLAISGKGGVGKTTLSGMVVGALALASREVIAVDADPDANLASALGVPADEPVTPLSEMRQLVEERTGSGEGYGGYFKINPKVDDIPESYARHVGNIRLLVLGGVDKGGAGCICPASALLKALLVHLVLGRDEHLIMDMEAGIEHLGRATAQSMDALLVVVNPASWSLQTAGRVGALAGDIGVKRILAVANRVREDTDLQAIQQQLGEIPLIGHLPLDDRFENGILSPAADGTITPSDVLSDHLPAVKEMLRRIQDAL